MEFKEGTGVYTADGQKVGTIDRVVIDPRTKRVSNVVIRKGFLFSEDKLVPIDLLSQASEDRLVLRPGVNGADSLPRFEETHYVPLAEEDYTPAAYPYNAPPLYLYPPVGLGPLNYPGFVTPEPIYVVHTERNIPEGSVALKEGSKVISRDGKYVGNVERVFADSVTSRATHLLISKGLLLKEQKLVLVSWIGNVTDEEVYLAVDARLLDTLPGYKDTSATASATA